MRDLDLTTLRLWVAVCDHQNIAKAAAAENIAASAISKRIAQMEATLGRQLLIRARRGVRLTPEGEALLEHARTLLFTVERIENDIAVGGAAGGYVRMLATPSAIAEALLDDVAAFMRAKENRGVRVNLEERLTHDVIRALREGVASVGVSWDNTDLAGVQHRPYRRDALAVAVHPDHPLARHKTLRFEQTLDYEQVSMPPVSSVQIMLQRAAARVGRTILYRAVVSNFDATVRVVAANLAIGVIPCEVGYQYAGSRNVKMIPLSDSWAQRRFVICFRDYDSLQPAARRMVDHLVAAASS
jgi:DNA-binding transcriptional LysR family regulator